MSVPEKYRPRALADVVGQPAVVQQLRAFAADPYPATFLFTGPTGTGKTSCAISLAAELGVAVDAAELGGLWQIPSGEQTASSVRAALAALATVPWQGSGWRVLVVNECDRLSDGAAFVWLDALESLPPRTVVIFTTNNAANLPARFRDRCETFRFQAASPMALAELVGRVWSGEGRTDAPPLLSGGSFRRALQELAPILRAGGQALATAVEEHGAPQRSPWWTVAALALAGLAAVAVILATSITENPRS